MRYKLPCRELHCELLYRMAKEGYPANLSFSETQIREVAVSLCSWFATRKVPPKDSLAVMEFAKACIWELQEITNKAENQVKGEDSR